MRRQRPGKRLTVFVGESQRYRHHALSQAIFERAREEGLAGATVNRFLLILDEMMVDGLVTVEDVVMYHPDQAE